MCYWNVFHPYNMRQFLMAVEVISNALVSLFLNWPMPGRAFMVNGLSHHWFGKWFVACSVPRPLPGLMLTFWQPNHQKPTQLNSNQYWNILNQDNMFDNFICKMSNILSQPQCLDNSRLRVKILNVFVNVTCKMSNILSQRQCLDDSRLHVKILCVPTWWSPQAVLCHRHCY